MKKKKFNEITNPVLIGRQFAEESDLPYRVRINASYYYAIWANLHGAIREYIEERWEGEKNTEAIRKMITPAMHEALHAMYLLHNKKTVEEALYGQEPLV